MKSLDERKKQRAEQRALLAHGGVIGLPGKDSQDQTANLGDEFDGKTVEQLKAWVKENGAEVPDEVSSLPAVLDYARNFKAYLESNRQTNQTSSGDWNQQ